MSFANKIALEYQLDITDEDVQIEILKAISVGSATTTNEKLKLLTTFKVTGNIISKNTWKAMSKAETHTHQGIIFAIRQLLKSLGINITKRKATQLIPVLGAISGGIINGSWAQDALLAVKQHARKITIQNYRAFLKDNATIVDCEDLSLSKS